MPPKDKATSNAAPMTYVVESRPNRRYQLEVEAREAAAESTTKASSKAPTK